MHLHIHVRIRTYVRIVTVERPKKNSEKVGASYCNSQSMRVLLWVSGDTRQKKRKAKKMTMENLSPALRAEFARLWVATDNAFSEKDKAKKGETVLSVRKELAELIDGATALRTHFDVDCFDDDKSMKEFPAVVRIRAKKGTKEEKTGNPFLVN